MDDIDRAGGMLKELWLSEIVSLRVSRRVWDQLRGPLSAYRQARRVLSWYRDSVLAGCRRLLDSDANSVSLVRALQLLRDNANDLTVERVVAVRAAHGHPLVDKELAELARSEFEGVGREVDGVLCLDPDVVRRDLAYLETLGKQVKRLATRTVAHRDRRPSVPELTEADVDRLLEAAASIHARWYGILLGADPDRTIEHLATTQDMTMALQMFDWRSFVEAEGEAEHALGPGAPPEAYEKIREGGHVHYCFDAHPSGAEL